MAIQQNFPNIKPTLLLDFANVKQLDPRITYSRASSGRFYDGVTTAKAEENLLLRSQEFDNAAWTKGRSSVTANNTAAPDGTSTADKLVEDTTASQTHFASQANTAIAGQNYTISVFAKASERSFIALGVIAGVQASGSSAVAAFFDLSAGTVTDTTASAVSTSITDAGGGWYRCAVTMQATGGAFTPTFYMSTSGTSGGQTYTGDGTSGLFLWGAQLEQRSTVTAYTPTTTQPITNYIPVLQTAPANTARFDHNPVTGESLGLLIEEQRTNLLLRSEEFETTWAIVGTASVATNTVVAPDGTLTADKFVLGDTITSGNGAVTQSATKPATSAPYTASVYIKAGEFNSLRLILRDAPNVSNFVQAFFNAATGVIAQAASAGGTFTAASATITPVGNGWYRCSVTGTTSTETSLSVRILSYQNGTGTATGDGYSGIYIWGAQLEAGAFPTSYIPTTSAQVTRSADAASMTGANFSSWYSADNVGTVYVEANETFAGNSSGPWWLNAGVIARGIAYRRTTATNNLELDYRQPDGTRRAMLVAGAIPAGQYNKVAAAFNASSSSVSANGASAETSTSNNLYPLVDQLRIGFAQVAGSSPFIWCGTIKKLSYYPKALTAAELAALTS